MTLLAARACLPLLLAVLAASAGSGQPPEPPPPAKAGPRPNPWIVGPPATKPTAPDAVPLPGDVGKDGPPPAFKPKDLFFAREGRPALLLETAFPDLKPRYEMADVRQPDGTVKQEVVENRFPPRPPLPEAGPSPLREVRAEQLRAGFEYLSRMGKLMDVRGLGEYLAEHIAMTLAVYRLAAETEDHPARRLPWIEALVRELKMTEAYTRARVGIGTDPPHAFYFVRFARLGAEAELLDLLAEAAKAGPPPLRMAPPRPPAVEPLAAAVRPPASGLAIAPPPRQVSPSGYTAFPDLRAFVRTHPDDVQPFPPGGAPDSLPALPLDAAAEVKARHAAVLHGLCYLYRVHRLQQIRGFGWDFSLNQATAADVYTLAAELEPTPADRVPWYEARVRALKTSEAFTEALVRIGTAPPQALCVAQFARLAAETDLIRLRAEAARAGPAGGKGARTPIDPEALPLKPQDVYTAFPDLKPRHEERQVEGPGGERTVVSVPVPLVFPPLAVAADAPLARKVRAERLQVGIDYLHRVDRQREIGGAGDDLRTHLAMVADVCALAAELEEVPARRVPWHEVAVRRLKLNEGYALARVGIGTLSPQELDFVRVRRLRAEIDLLRLTAEVEAAKRLPGKPGPSCDR